MVNPRRNFFYDDDSDLFYVQFPYTYEHYHAFEGYNVGAYRGLHDSLKEGARRQQRSRSGSQAAERGPYEGKGPRNFVRADARILDDVNYRLTRNGRVNASHIGVTVKDGVVALSGTAPDRRQKWLAEDVAGSVFGVKDVENLLKVPRGR